MPDIYKKIRSQELIKDKFNECKIFEDKIYLHKNVYMKNQAGLCPKNKNIVRIRFDLISPNTLSNYNFFLYLFYIYLFKMKKATKYSFFKLILLIGITEAATQ